MKRYLVTALFIVLVPFAAAGNCKPIVCDGPTGDCNPRPSAPAPSPTPIGNCAISGITGSCVASPSKKP